MNVRVIYEIKSAKGIIPVGRTLEISPAVFEKLQGKVELLPEVRNPQKFPHFCPAAGMWCSSRLPNHNHPNECVRLGCKYHQAAQDTPQATNDQQRSLTPDTSGGNTP